MSSSAASPKFRWNSNLSLWAGGTLVLAFFIATAAMEHGNIRTLRASARRVSQTHEVVEALEQLLSAMKDAETGQRGYIITGNEAYLQPYLAAAPRMDQLFAGLARLTADNPLQRERLEALRQAAEVKRSEMARILEIRQTQGFDAARDAVATNRGKAAMDTVRAEAAVMQEEEKRALEERFAETEAAHLSALRGAVATGLLGVSLTVAIAFLLHRAKRVRERQEWLRMGRTRVSESLLGDRQIGELGEAALRGLCEYLGAKAGVVFIEDGGLFRRAATYAIPPDAKLPERFAPGEGLIGQAVKDGRSFAVEDVPAEYLAIGSGLGQMRPRHLLIAPAKVDGVVNAVLELGFLKPVPDDVLELLERSAEAIGVSVRSAQARSRILELLEETQRQAEEMQTQSEELRVTNEELTEQTHALQQSQAQLEQQQVMLEESNTQLSEQKKLLESQRDYLSEAKGQLEVQARLVEQASRYKSDFLANMSHELRTPLNSSLILAQLLAENRAGNLTEEQVKFARTIQSSGNDLLALINDVLDLSKIEAGRMDLRPEPLALPRLLETMRGQFEPVATKRGLTLRLDTAPGTPETIETDAQRLEQVLRNLMSNALKFTEKGEVSLEVSLAAAGRVAFAVRDTGIGIEPAQQRAIFDPFTQADGTTSRKYGGTGLGLSISRELARLLGGEIQLASEPGKGSVFTLILPQRLEDPAPRAEVASEPVAPQPAPVVRVPGGQLTAPSAESQREQPDDDRAQIRGTDRVILIVEDDPGFAQSLVAVAHEQRFQCLVAHFAQDALTLARQYVPSAILLDIGLPDGSGLFVLEQLKHDARTRHIPVHVVSGNDYAEKALQMGAVGYFLKPVQREKLAEAFHDLEQRLTHRLRRVLVVEDDVAQREALCHLLASREVQALGAGNAAECMARLSQETFDCMVLDLSLPDASGFALLEKLNSDEGQPFPPVIIYTGREMSAEEEQRLRRYSKSIIIKGAKSPERLLDEVALFLHQVVSELPAEQQQMIEKARSREAALEGRRVLVAEDDVRNIFALTSLLEPLGLQLAIARNGREALTALERAQEGEAAPIDLVLMDIMMPEMDGLTAMREIRKHPAWRKLPIIALTAKAMPNDQQECLAAGANDYLAKPLDVEKLLSLIRVWMPR